MVPTYMLIIIAVAAIFLLVWIIALLTTCVHENPFGVDEHEEMTRPTTPGLPHHRRKK